MRMLIKKEKQVRAQTNTSPNFLQEKIKSNKSTDQEIKQQTTKKPKKQQNKLTDMRERKKEKQ